MEKRDSRHFVRDPLDRSQNIAPPEPLSVLDGETTLKQELEQNALPRLQRNERYVRKGEELDPVLAVHLGRSVFRCSQTSSINFCARASASIAATRAFFCKFLVGIGNISFKQRTRKQSYLG
jgi:hypothetical protein